MSVQRFRARTFAGTIEIEASQSLQETAKRVGATLSVTFAEETTGRYEEFPAFVASAAGFQFVLLGPPEPEHDFREVKSNELQLMIDSQAVGGAEPEDGHHIEVSSFYARLIQRKTGLRCEAIEIPNAT